MASSEELAKGTRLLDRYTVVQKVATGGMATIHTAVDDRLDRVVCVKVLRITMGEGSSGGASEPDSPAYVHFLREAKALSKLQHPNTLRIYDFGYIDPGRRPFQVSEFLDGGTLRHHVRSHGPLSLPEALAVIDPITGAMAEAHDRQILHRDIKPSNILFARLGDSLVPKLADFGIARTSAARLSKAEHKEGVRSGEEGAGLFSPRWAAPEQVMGEVEGTYTDVYALALVTAFMLTGTQLPNADATESRWDRDRRLRAHIGALPLAAEVRDVLLKATAVEPLARTQTPGQFAHGIRAVSGDVRAPLRVARSPASTTTPATIPGGPPPSLPSSITAPGSRTAPSAGVVPPEKPPSGKVGRQVRIVDTHETLELDLGKGGADVRFRVSFLPEQNGVPRIQIKGLSCFVTGEAAPGRPTPAVTAGTDGSVVFVSAQRHPLGRLTFAFGHPTDSRGRVFSIGGVDLVIPSPDGSSMVALDLGPEREIVVLRKRG
jgi:serine/threonine-protein kinase